MTFPLLDDVITAEDVSHKGTGRFSASFVNWSKVSHLLRTHAPGWESYYIPAADGGMCHAAPDGTYFLLIGFKKWDSEEKRTIRTQPVPHAVMDHKMGAKSSVSARDVSDAYVRGMCKAAALRFGLGWRLWSKDDPFERDDDSSSPPRKVAAKAAKRPAAKPFGDPAEAATELKACKTFLDVESWGRRVRESGFVDEELDVLRESAREHRESITEEAA